MEKKNNLQQELQSLKYASFPEITKRVRELSIQYGDMPFNNIVSAFSNAGFGAFGITGRGGMNDPYIQNNRVKHITSSAKKFRKPQVEAMLDDASSHEIELREVEHWLEYPSYPLFHTRTVYQNLLTYHSYVAPYLVDKADSEKNEFWREWKLLEKLRTTFDIKSITHEITGQALQEGKVFYVPRYSVDKAHNKVNHAFLQQLPSDWTKIVGYNNVSKYTIAFDLMYFTHYGTCPNQFGDLFTPYLSDFDTIVSPVPKDVGSKIIYAEQKAKVDMTRLNEIQPKADVYCQNGRWFYWVTLPIDKVFTFEIDDTNRNVVTPFTGLLLDMLQLSALENLQMELLANPLIGIVLGEIPYFETKDTNSEDQYKLSMAARHMFETFWYEMTRMTNTGGIGLYSAPFKNMKLETLPEAPNATNIVSSGYQDTMNKAGLGGIIPTTTDTRSGLAQISLKIESQFPKTVYRCMERMMNTIIDKLNLRYDFRFYMFGDIESDDRIREESRKDMTLGITPAAIIYNALHDRSVIEDIAWSDAIFVSGLLDKRIPLMTSYSGSPENTGLPPRSENKIADPNADPNRDVGGRPSSDTPQSDGAEQDEDSYGDARFKA